ncbi:hypothetical protein ACP70R_018235 [Stipagrostis hirtigluma subsp. patula]
MNRIGSNGWSKWDANEGYLKGDLNQSHRYAHGRHSHGRGFLDPSYRIGFEQKMKNQIPCKFYARGQCWNGQTCKYLHDNGHQTQMGLGAPIAMPNQGYFPDSGHRSQMGLGAPVDFPNWGHCLDSAPLKQMGFSAPSSMIPHIFPRNDQENPVSQSAISDHTTFDYNDWHFKDSGSQQANHQICGVPTLHKIHRASNSRDEFENSESEYSEMSPFIGWTSVTTGNVQIGSLASTTCPVSTHMPTALWPSSGQMHQKRQVL